jgi:hypothetical protein
MLFTILLLLSGLTLSAVAIYYSVIGLTSIFAAAFWPIVVMGTTLEVSKLVAASWLKFYWTQIPRMMKLYMTTAVIVLMVITSMGIFGFLSKAHSDQSLVSGDVQAKIAVYDEKIKTAKDNIDANRKALKQMDEAVDQVMGRSQDEKGADKAVAIRRGQAKERTRLLSEITAEQKVIAQLSEERAPIAAEVRKVEAEVGPIKYIAAFIYGDNPDANLLEKAVTWVIVIIVAVFDPLAVLMLLGAQMTLLWHRERTKATPVAETKVEEVVPAFVPVAVAANDDIDIVAEANAKIAEIEPAEPVFEVPEEDKPEPIQCYKCGTELMDAPGIGPFCPNKECDVLDATSGETIEIQINVKPDLTWPFPAKAEFDATAHAKTYTPVEEEKDIVDEVGVDTWNKLLADAEDAVEAEKAAMRRWKEEHPEETIKHVRQQKELGIIDELPWQDLERPGDYLTPPEDDSKKKTTYIMKDGSQQVKKTRD